MAVYQVTIMWGVATIGATETYWTADASTTTAAQRIQNLLSARADLLPMRAYCVGVRVSLAGTRRAAQLMTPGKNNWLPSGTQIIVPANGTYQGEVLGAVINQTRAALQVVVGFANNRKTTRYLAGVPAAVAQIEPDTVRWEAVPIWQAAYTRWQNRLLADGWQIRAQQLPPAITAYSVVGLVSGPAPTNFLGIQIATTVASGIRRGDKIAVQGFRPAKGTRAWTLNGTWNVDSIDESNVTNYTTLYLRGSSGIVAADQRFTQATLVRKVTYDYYPILSYEWQRGGIHKRGKPSLAPRGRRSTRGSLDP